MDLNNKDNWKHKYNEMKIKYIICCEKNEELIAELIQNKKFVEDFEKRDAEWEDNYNKLVEKYNKMIEEERND